MTPNMIKTTFPEEGSTKFIHLKTSFEIHSEIKSYAASQGLSIKSLLMIAYQEYRNKHTSS